MKKEILMEQDMVLPVDLQFQDADGFPVFSVDKPRWFSSQPKVVKLEVSEDGLSGKVISLKPGVTTLTITYTLPEAPTLRRRKRKRIKVVKKSKVSTK